MKYFTYIFVLVQILVIAPAAASEPTKASFQKLNQARWQVALEDSCTQGWRRNWILDGKKATIVHSDKGMDFRAGPTWKDDASHAVLWTKKSFQGDIKIEYEYARTDDADRAVTILYVQATGSGSPPYARDIADWAELREVPSMPTYWKNMHTYHISYAAFGSKDDPQADYIRARRYLPGRNASLFGTELAPDYFEAGLFETNVPHKITVIKVGDELFMRIRNKDRSVYCRWTNNSRPILEGRISLRHMYTRGARYKDFRVYILETRS